MVLDAAVECIVEEGFYRASSNRIAERAGVTWGVIQHHFGTRERLLLAVFQRSADRLGALLTTANVEGDDVGARLESLAELIWAHYRQPEFLASLQIVLNLGRDPRTARQTVETLGSLNQQAAQGWERLYRQVVPSSTGQAHLATSLFNIMRGLAIGEELSDAISGLHSPRVRDDPVRQAMVKALALLIECDAAG